MAATAMKHMAANFAKLDKFEGVDFRRWQNKMQFLLSSMSVVYMLTTHIPEDGENATMEQIRRGNKWGNDDYVCRGLILNGLQHKMNMDEVVQVSCIIDKLSPSWKDFNHTLKHKKEELTLVELGSHLRIEESLRVTRDEISDQHSYCFNVEDDPKTFDESIKSQDVALWKKAINDKKDFIMGNNTWVLTNLPPVEHISTIRLLIALALIHKLIIHQMDAKTTLLNGELDDKAVSQLKYSRVIGCLMYAMTCTRLDIAFVMGKLSRHVYAISSLMDTTYWLSE
nr:zinc finger, CCHC-type [Tanacetum cinerariifolium]